MFSDISIISFSSSCSTISALGLLSDVVCVVLVSDVVVDAVSLLSGSSIFVKSVSKPSSFIALPVIWLVDAEDGLVVDVLVSVGVDVVSVCEGVCGEALVLVGVELGAFVGVWVWLVRVDWVFNFSISSASLKSRNFLLHLSSILHANSKFSSTMQPTYFPLNALMHNGSGCPAVSRKWGEFAANVP